MNPSSSQARLIGVSALITAAVITAAEAERTGTLPAPERWIGFALAFFLMGALDDLGVPIGGGLAVLLATATTLTRGDEALRLARRRTRARLPRQPTGGRRRNEPRTRAVTTPV